MSRNGLIYICVYLEFPLNLYNHYQDHVKLSAQVVAPLPNCSCSNISRIAKIRKDPVGHQLLTEELQYIVCVTHLLMCHLQTMAYFLIPKSPPDNFCTCLSASYAQAH